MTQPTLTSQWRWTTACLCERILQMKSQRIDGELLAAEGSRRAGGRGFALRGPDVASVTTSLLLKSQTRSTNDVMLSGCVWHPATCWRLFMSSVCMCFLFRTDISCTHRPNQWFWKKDKLLKTNTVVTGLLCEPSPACFDAPADVRQPGPDNMSVLHTLTPLPLSIKHTSVSVL